MPLYDITVCTLPKHYEDICSVYAVGELTTPKNPDNPLDKGFIIVPNVFMEKEEARMLTEGWYPGGVRKDEAERPVFEDMAAIAQVIQPFLITVGTETFVPVESKAACNAAIEAYRVDHPAPVPVKPVEKRRFKFPLVKIKAEYPDFDIARASDPTVTYQPFRGRNDTVISTLNKKNYFFDKHAAKAGGTGFKYKEAN